VRGEKIALIDVSHERFFDEYVKHIEEITPLDKIDYLIINHCEPDHTGALKKLIELIPHVKIFTTPAGNINLKFITNNSQLNITVIKNLEILDLGNGKKLEFILAPFLH
jgi:flavorubredoxin